MCFRILRSRYYSMYRYQMVLSLNGKSFIALLMSRVRKPGDTCLFGSR